LLEVIVDEELAHGVRCTGVKSPSGKGKLTG
jgi:hypothetical protein